MKIPAWKKYLSYFTDLSLAYSSSNVNPDLHVILSNGRIQLCSKNAIYSFEDLYKNFALLFDLIELKAINEKDILILGFGLGSIPIILEKKAIKVKSIVGVEIDEAIIDFANIYSLDKIQTPIQIINTDAQTFVASSLQSFDVIIIDVFLDDKIPDDILQISFFEQINKLLKTEESLVIMNTMYNDEKTKKTTDDFFNSNFKKVFKKAIGINLHMNRMLLNIDKRIK